METYSEPKSPSSPPADRLQQVAAALEAIKWTLLAAAVDIRDAHHAAQILKMAQAAGAAAIPLRRISRVLHREAQLA